MKKIEVKRALKEQLIALKRLQPSDIASTNDIEKVGDICQAAIKEFPNLKLSEYERVFSLVDDIYYQQFGIVGLENSLSTQDQDEEEANSPIDLIRDLHTVKDYDAGIMVTANNDLINITNEWLIRVLQNCRYEYAKAGKQAVFSPKLSETNIAWPDLYEATKQAGPENIRQLFELAFKQVSVDRVINEELIIIQIIAKLAPYLNQRTVQEIKSAIGLDKLVQPTDLLNKWIETKPTNAAKKFPIATFAAWFNHFANWSDDNDAFSQTYVLTGSLTNLSEASIKPVDTTALTEMLNTLLSIGKTVFLPLLKGLI